MGNVIFLRYSSKVNVLTVVESNDKPLRAFTSSVQAILLVYLEFTNLIEELWLLQCQHLHANIHVHCIVHVDLVIVCCLAKRPIMFPLRYD